MRYLTKQKKKNTKTKVDSFKINIDKNLERVIKKKKKKWKRGMEGKKEERQQGRGNTNYQ